MNDFASMSNADLLAAYKTAKDPFEGALAAEGVTGKLADVARSIYQQESAGGKNTKTSNAGAVGGMQITPSTFASVADKGWSIDDPVQNARAGIRYLKQLDQKSGGDPALTAAGYYGGPGAMEKARKGIAVSDPRNPTAPTTLQYGQQVAARIPQNPVVRGLNAVTDAVMPAPQAAEPSSDFKGMSDADLLAAYQKAKAPKAEPGGLLQGAGNLVAGAVRGAGSIGATLLSPIDAAARAVNGGNPISVGGFDIAGQDRRAGMDAGLTELGAQPDSLMFKGGKLAGEIAGTAGAGGVVANGIGKALPAAATAAPRVAQALEAIKTGGFSLGTPAATTLGGKAADLAIRSAGGAISGSASAGLVDPEQAKGGAIVGGILPGAAQAAGMVANKLSGIIRGPEQSADAISAIKAARDAGYVIPPTQAKPTLTNRLLEGFSGKITTAQNASARNQGVTNRLAASAVGLDPTQPITKDSLKAVRDVAGEAYEALKGRGSFAVDDEYLRTVAGLGNKNALITEAFPGIRGGGMHGDPVDGLVKSMTPTGENISAEATVEAIKQLRFQAKGNMKNFQDPVKLELGRAQSNASEALESLIERNLANSGNPELLGRFKDARQLIAKTRTIEDALNGASGNVDASKLAQALKRGRPLSGDLLAVAQFASRFPKAAQTVEKMGSLPQTSPLDWAAGGAISAATANPLALAGVAARPAARALTLSNLVQNRLAQPQSSNRLVELLSSPEGQQLMYRMAPQAATSSR